MIRDLGCDLVELQSGDSLRVEWHSRRIDTIFMEDTFMPYQSCFVEGDTLSLHDILDFSGAFLIKACPRVSSYDKEVVLFEIKVVRC